MNANNVRRADAERNREKILVAAEQALADTDGEVSMAGIARRADVGMATLYRNFPARRDLLEALYAGEVEAICEAAANSAGLDAVSALTRWLRGFHAFSMSKRRIARELLKQTDINDLLFGGSRSRVIAAGRPLLKAAQATGKVRSDLDLEQILDMMVAIATINGESKYVEPILDTVIAGLRN